MDAAATSSLTYGRTVAPFINTMVASMVSDDVVDVSLITSIGSYNLALQLMNSDGSLSSLVECIINVVANCDAEGGSFPSSGS